MSNGHWKTGTAQRRVLRGLFVALATTALSVTVPVGAVSASARVQSVPAALQLPMYQALAADTSVQFEDGCSTLKAQGLKGCFDAAGSRFSGAGERPLALHLAGYGRGAALRAVTPSKPVIADQRVRYDHGDISEWWQVLPMGFEQGFTVTERLDGADPLVLELAGSQPAGFEDGTLSFGNLRYGKLVVSDANGHVVPSAFDVEGKRVLIKVNDADAAYPLTVDPLVWIEQKVTAGDAGEDNFGLSLAIAGDIAVVGANATDVGSNSSQGAAYVFTRSNGTWNKSQKLTASDGAGYDNFGIKVATDGESVLVGATVDAGAVYLFTQSGGIWSQSHRFEPSDGAASGIFGTSVGIDGDTVVVGAGNAKVGSNPVQGKVYVFTQKNNGSWGEVQLSASDGAERDYFGRSVAIDGDTIVIGSREADVNGNANQGAAYVFSYGFYRVGTVVIEGWYEEVKLSADDGAVDDGFGWSVSIDGDAAVIGAHYADIDGTAKQGAAYVFADTNGSGWSQRKKLMASDGLAGDEFGYDVAISGKTAVVGAYKAGVESGQGRAYLFTREAGSWSEQGTLTASDGMADDNFGKSVAVDGNTVLIGQLRAFSAGAPSNSAVYFYGANDLDFAISVPDTVTAGEEYTSQTIVTNKADEDSPSAVTAIIPIPVGTSFVSTNTTQGGCSGNSGIVTCALGVIPGNAGTVTANLMLKATGRVGDTIDNNASIARTVSMVSGSRSTEIRAKETSSSGGSGSGGGGAVSLLCLAVLLMSGRRRSRQR